MRASEQGTALKHGKLLRPACWIAVGQMAVHQRFILLKAPRHRPLIEGCHDKPPSVRKQLRCLHQRAEITHLGAGIGRQPLNAFRTQWDRR